MAPWPPARRSAFITVWLWSIAPIMMAMFEESLTDNLGVDDAYLLKLILVDARGPRIRHRVAHGNVTAGECTEMIAFMMVVLVLHMSGYVRSASDAAHGGHAAGGS